MAVVIVLVLLGTVIGVALAVFGTATAAAGPTATLTVFTGSARIRKSGSTTTVAAHSGEAVASGDSVSTAANSKAAVTYPDGSVTRLDSSSRITLSLARAGRSAFRLSISQTAGLSWNTVKKLVGAGSFRISGPNNAVAGVRGTRFGFYIEKSPAGKTVVWVDVYDGVVAVSGAVGPSVTATANQRVNVSAGTAPSSPVTIPDSDRHLSFTVFNQALEAVTGKPVGFYNGVLSSGQTAGPLTYAADGKGDLEFVLGWPGSIFELTVVDPAGTIFAQPAATATPIVVRVPRAVAGSWQFRVRDVTSVPLEPWWVVVGRS
ncbi:MAG TPA: FecR family protein [Candidatus Dormibacteraeota bacterium]|nr:FecR family protein [Candidatus Dormibacteraeota bacterium]